MRTVHVAAMVALSIPLLGSARVQAGMVEIDAVIASGLYDGGVHFPHHMNYFVGYSIPSAPLERRNYFVFNLVDVDKPIVSAKLKLYLPGAPELPLGYISSEPTETYRISGTPIAAEVFLAAFMGDAAVTPGVVAAMFGTLGSMPPFGVTVVSADHGGSDVVIDFTAEGITALNAALGSLIVIGGRLTDIHPEAPSTTLPSELVFAYTDVGAHPDIVFPRLELVLVPESRTLILLASSSLILLCIVRRAGYAERCLGKGMVRRMGA